MDNAAALGRLRWRCRRGMKEPDILLVRWLDRRYAGATADERVAFGRLLQAQDPELVAWLLKGQPATVPACRGWSMTCWHFRSDLAPCRGLAAGMAVLLLSAACLPWLAGVPAAPAAVRSLLALAALPAGLRGVPGPWCAVRGLGGGPDHLVLLPDGDPAEPRRATRVLPGLVLLPSRPGAGAGRPILMSAGNRGEMIPAQIDRVGRLGDGVITTYLTDDDCRQLRQACDDAFAKHGRARPGFPMCVYTTVRLENDVARAEALTRDFQPKYYGGGVNYRGLMGLGPAPAVIETLKRYEAAGATDLCIRFAGADQVPQLEQFISEVAPAFAGAR